jgi:hypothetical protein
MLEASCRIARHMLNKVTVENRTAVEVTPRPDLLPFFVSVSDPNAYGRKRRGTVSRFPDAASVVIAEAPERNPAGKSGREGYQQPRARKLGEAERTAIRQAVTEGRSLRRLAAEYGVSHETIRVSASQQELPRGRNGDL